MADKIIFLNFTFQKKIQNRPKYFLFLSRVPPKYANHKNVFLCLKKEFILFASIFLSFLREIFWIFFFCQVTKKNLGHKKRPGWPGTPGKWWIGLAFKRIQNWVQILSFVSEISKGIWIANLAPKFEKEDFKIWMSQTKFKF